MIPVCRPWLCGREKEYVNRALEMNWISSNGQFIEEFERAFARLCNCEFGVSCSSGLAALHLACVALGLRRGDEVVVPSFTMIASVNAVVYTGATPVLVDADKDTYCMDVKNIENKITNRTRAIMPVHIYGHPCDMDAIRKIADEHELHIIEDAAEAHGAEYKGEKCGSLSDIGCFSFYANKILTTGEGGMCVTHDRKLADRMRMLRNHAFGSSRFTHHEVGFNYRMTNIQAAIGLAQVENANKLIEARRGVGLRYNRLLSNGPLVLPIEREYAKNVYWMYGVVLKDQVELSRDQVMQQLEERGIETRPFFVPMNRQPVFRNRTVENAPDCDGEYPVADKISQRGFYLPSSSNLSETEMNQVCENLREVLRF
jgi:perosamine synthetase